LRTVLAAINDAFGVALLSLQGRPGRRNGDVRPNQETTAGSLNRNTMRLRLFAANNNIAPGATMVVRKRYVYIHAYLLGKPLPGWRHPVKA